VAAQQQDFGGLQRLQQEALVAQSPKWRVDRGLALALDAAVVRYRRFRALGRALW
jgi:hypothetical protein